MTSRPIRAGCRRFRSCGAAWAEAARCVRKAHGALPDECRRYFIIRCIIDDQVKDVVHSSEERLAATRVNSADDVRRQPKPLVAYSETRRKLNIELRKYLYKNLYFNPEVYEPNRRAVKMLDDLFHHYLKHHNEIGEVSQRRAKKEGWHRAICDYLAGMTDRYAAQEHQRVFGLRV